MKKFVQVRLQSKNNGSNSSTTDHNLRMNETQNQLNQLHNILIYQNKIIRDNNLIKLEYNNIQNDRRQYIKEHNDLYMKNNENRHLKSCHSSISEGVITFSELIKDKMKEENFTEELLRIGQNCIKEISEKLDTEILYISLHLDETTPHFHFTYKNYDNKGHSITHKNKKKEFLSDLQTLVGKHFEELGFERGIKKDFTGRNYQTTKDFHNKEIDILKNERENLLKTIKTIQKEKVILQEDKKKIKINLDLEIKDKKTEYEKIDKKIKELNATITTLKTELREKEEENKKVKDINTDLTNKNLEIISERDNLQKTIEIQNNTIENNNNIIKDLKKVSDYKDYKKDSVEFFKEFFTKEEKTVKNISTNLFNTVQGKIEQNKEHKIGLKGTIDFDNFVDKLEKYTQRQRVYSLDTEKQTKINELLKIVEGKDKLITDLSNKNRNSNNEIKDLTNKNENLTNKNEKLETDLSGLITKVEKLEPLNEKNKELITKNEEIKENYNELIPKYKELLDYQRENAPKLLKLSKLETDNEELTKKNKSLTTDNNFLKIQNNSLKETINKITDSFNYLRNKFMNIKEFLTPKEIIENHKINTINNNRHHKQ